MAQENYIWFQGYVYRAEEDAPNFQKTYTLTDGTHTASVHHLYVMPVKGKRELAGCLLHRAGHRSLPRHRLRGRFRCWGIRGLEGSSYAESAAGHRPCYALQRAAPSGHVIFCRERGMGGGYPDHDLGDRHQVCEAAPAPYACMDTGLIDQFTGSVGTVTGKITPSVPSGPNTTFSAENWQSTA